MKGLKIKCQQEYHYGGRGELYSVWLGFKQLGKNYVWLADFRNEASAELFIERFKSEVKDETDINKIRKKFFPNQIRR
jgi:hypothetical protein